MEEQEIKEKETPKKKNIKKVFIFLILLFFVFYLYIRFIEPNTIVVHEYKIEDTELPTSFDGMKIVHFSDILYGSTIHSKNISKVVKKINELKPDIVVFTGDLWNASLHISDESLQILKDELQKIEVTFKKYAVIGDSDYINKDLYIEVMQEANFSVLENESDLFYYDSNTPLQFIGTTSLLEHEIDIEKAYYLEEPQESYQIWLHHEPIILDTLLEKEIKPNVILTGHTLNGLMSIPFKGYLLNQDGVQKYKENYCEQEDIKMYVSNGLGTYKYNVRFLNYPSINLYRFYSE